jgi:hypothetical protein
MKYWQDDNWTNFETEEGELVDANLWTCDVSGRQYITFYPTTKNQQGLLETDTSVSLATYEVNLVQNQIKNARAEDC